MKRQIVARIGGRFRPNVHTLRQIVMLQALDWETLAELSGISSCERYAAGAEIDQPPEGECEALLVMAGEVCASLASTDGRELLISVLRGGEAFKFGNDVETVLDAIVVRSVTPNTVVCRTPWPAFIYRVSTSPGSAALLLEQLDRRFEEVVAAASDRMHPIEARLRRVLWREARHADGHAVFFTHEQLARRIGTTRARVTGLLGRLAELGLIECEAHSHRITVLDGKGLVSD